MKITRLVIPDVILIEPEVFSDERGFFFESFNQKIFEEATGLSPTFVQDSHSKSTRGVLRGLHYQLPPKAQGKLVRVIHGEVFDVTVDIRKTSPTFGQWVGVELTEDNNRQVWAPPGFAHGFVVLSENADFLYKATNYYDPFYERSILWNDVNLCIEWPNMNPILSQKDKRGATLNQAEVFT